MVTAQADGAYAEYSVAPADFVAYVPDAVSAEVAASSLLKGMTAHYLLKSVYPVQQGDTVLVHAGAGGVGLILTQWATSMAVKVITTVSTSRQGRTVPAGRRRRGARLPGRPAEFGARIRELTGGRGVAAVYDGVGASTFEASLASLAVRGTLALFGASSGPVPAVRPATPQQRGLAVPHPAHAGALHPHSRRVLLACRRTARRDRDGDASTMTVSERYPLADAAKAHTDLQGRKTVGSVVLVP